MNSDGASGMGMVGGVILTVLILAVVGVMIASMWKVFEKAGQPGWAALVPIYNLIILLKITGKPLWWIALFVIPIANFIAMILVTIAVAKSFGKSTGFGLGLLFLGFIFYPMLAFGDAHYMGPAGDGRLIPATV